MLKTKNESEGQLDKLSKKEALYLKKRKLSVVF
jgi:hypothetical protein